MPQVEIIEFDNRMEKLIAGARAVVGMGGYNTFCEILSFDKPALIVPRITPREEQLIRARRAAELGLIDMLLPEEAADPDRFAAGAEGAARSRRRRRSAVPGSSSTVSTTSPISSATGSSARSQKRFSVIEGDELTPANGAQIVVVLKGYPRLSETFIAQELLGLEQAGLELVTRLAAPSDRHASAIRCMTKSRRRSRYLPEYLHDEPTARASRALAHRAPAAGLSPRARAPSSPTMRATAPATGSAASARRWCWRPNSRAMPTGCMPISSTRRPRSRAYASLMHRLGWSCSAHAKDIWTSPDWELRDKLGERALGRDLHAGGLRSPQALAPDPAQSASELSRPRSRRASATSQASGRRATASDPSDPVDTSQRRPRGREEGL